MMKNLSKYIIEKNANVKMEEIIAEDVVPILKIMIKNLI